MVDCSLAIPQLKLNKICARRHLTAGQGNRPRSHPPIAGASVMRMTAIHAQTERKR